MSSYYICFVHRWFWVSWLDGEIEVGRGMTIGSGRIFYYSDIRLFWVNAVEFGQGVQYQGGNDLVWEVPMMAIREFILTFMVL